MLTTLCPAHILYIPLLFCSPSCDTYGYFRALLVKDSHGCVCSPICYWNSDLVSNCCPCISIQLTLKHLNQLVPKCNHHRSSHEPPCLPSTQKKKTKSPIFLTFLLHLLPQCKASPYTISPARNLRSPSKPLPASPPGFNNHILSILPAVRKQCESFMFLAGQGFLSKIYWHPGSKVKWIQPFLGGQSELLQRDLQIYLPWSYSFIDLHLHSL